MPTKNVAVQVKATAADDTTLADGQFIALASVFNNVDAVGDVVMPGAFAEDLKAWEASGDTIPVYWAHQMNNPNMNIGAVIKAEETAEGLLVKAQLDLDTTEGKQVYRLLKGRRVNRMSFAYDITDGADAERDGQTVYELRALKLHEVSVVQVPANPAAVVREVKTQPVTTTTYVNTAGPEGYMTNPFGHWVFVDESPAVKAGRILSAKNETLLRGAVTQISAGTTDVKSVLGSLETSDDGKATSTQPAVTSPEKAKDDAPARSGPASACLRADLFAQATEVFVTHGIEE